MRPSSRLSRRTTAIGGVKNSVTEIASQLTSEMSSPTRTSRARSSASAPLTSWLPPATIAVTGERSSSILAVASRPNSSVSVPSSTSDSSVSPRSA